MGNVLLPVAIVAAFGATARADERGQFYADDGWAGFMNDDPKLYSPKDLAEHVYSDKLTEGQGGELGKCGYDDDIWYTRYESPEKTDNWMMFTYPCSTVWDPDAAVLVWQLGLDHPSEKVYANYWDPLGGEREQLDYNGGGYEPATVYSDAIWAFTGDDDHVVILFVGETPSAGQDWMKCDVAYFEYIRLSK